MKIMKTFTTLAVVAIAFSTAEGRALRGVAAEPEFEEDLAGIIGRPLTPVSVAGSARRVSRRTARRNSRMLTLDPDAEEQNYYNNHGYRQLLNEVDEDGAGVVGRPLLVALLVQSNCHCQLSGCAGRACRSYVSMPSWECPRPCAARSGSTSCKAVATTGRMVDVPRRSCSKCRGDIWCRVVSSCVVGTVAMIQR